MDLLTRLLGHDAWTTRQLLLCCQRLTDVQLDREFDIGHRTVRLTFQHIIRNMEVWTDLISEQTPRTVIPAKCTVESLLQRLDEVTPQLASISAQIQQQCRLDDRFMDHLDDPPTLKTFGGAIAHVVTHSMHHRAQLMYMLRRLGVQEVIEGDVLSWEQQREV